LDWLGLAGWLADWLAGSEKRRRHITRRPAPLPLGLKYTQYEEGPKKKSKAKDKTEKLRNQE
jgi:hypothetical protein